MKMGRTRMVFRAQSEVDLRRIVGRVIGNVILDVAVDMDRYVPVDQGDLQESIDPDHDGGDEGKIWLGTDHWYFPEFGTRYMDAQPYARPAVYQTRELRTN